MSTQPNPTRARVCPPCDGNCRQGRDCPAAQPETVTTKHDPWAIRLIAVWCIVVALFVGLKLATWLRDSAAAQRVEARK